MQDVGRELPGTPLPRTWVNKLISRQKCKNITNLAHLSDALCPSGAYAAYLTCKWWSIRIGKKDGRSRPRH